MTLSHEIAQVRRWEGPRTSGRVTHVIGLLIESTGPQASIGELCTIYGKEGKAIPCQVVGFKEQQVLLMSLGTTTAIAPGAEVYPMEMSDRIGVSEALCGRILDARGQPIDGKGAIPFETTYPTSAEPPDPLKRRPIDQVLQTGIKGIDGLCTLGRGQRVGIVAEAGVGKSTLMGMIARQATSDINVIALIGERGREVREFIEQDLGPEGLARSVVVVATSDQAALFRSRGADVATAIAEYFRDKGKEVILMMDSISRYAMARREIGLAIGEPPTTRGYPPSVFAHLPRLLERTGTSEKGSITGIYTILEEEDDPVAVQVRSLLDGHLLLSRSLAAQGHFPPLDILGSLSRLMRNLTSHSHQKKALQVRAWLQTYAEAEELISLGAYVAGSNPKIDKAIEKREPLSHFLKQEAHENVSFEEMLEQLESL